MFSVLYKFIKPFLYKCNTITSSPADLLFLQIFDGEYCHPDTLVKYMFIENYYGKNNFGKDLYIKLQQNRGNVKDPEKIVFKFNNFISSVEKNGYSSDSVVGVDRKFYLRDGSHRNAMGLYLGLKNIKINFLNMDYPLNYKYSWFRDNGFSEEEISLIQNKEAEIMDKANAPLNIVLFGSCCDEADEACRILSEFGDVVDCTQYYPDEVECYNLCIDIISAADLYGDKRDTKISIKNPRFAVIRLKLTAPEMTTVENNELKILKRFINYRIPVIKQSQKIRKVLTDKTFIKNNQLFIPQNFWQNSQFNSMLNKYIK